MASVKLLHQKCRDTIPEELLQYLPKKWFILGHVLLFQLHPKLDPWKEMIGKFLLDVDHRPVRTAIMQIGAISGDFRIPQYEIVYGNTTETIHKEAGCIFKLDPTKIMFSPGNTEERQRLPRFVQENDVVVDFFACIGQFSIPLGKVCRKVYAIELNEIAYSYLCENIRLNKLEKRIIPLQGDCREVAPEKVADHVILGYLFETHKYLQKAIKALKSEGGWIHYHEALPRLEFPDIPMKKIRMASEALGFEIKDQKTRLVKTYAPNIVHGRVSTYLKPL
ncbi:MAG: class I SAM-dependent methyltransferase family protein [Promethearchaeota archaeon]